MRVVLSVRVLNNRHVVDLLELWLLIMLDLQNWVAFRILGTFIKTLDGHHGGRAHLHLLLMVERSQSHPSLGIDLPQIRRGSLKIVLLAEFHDAILLLADLDLITKIIILLHWHR